MLKKLVLIVFTLITLAFSACNPARNIPAGKYLLGRNIILPDSNVLAKEKFETLIRLKPNRKLLGFWRFHLGLYNIGNSGKDRWYKRAFRRIGEEPVIVDSFAIDKSLEQFKLYLNKNGFFNNVVSDSIKYKKNKRAVVSYYIHYAQPYTINGISYSTQDTGISKLINYFQEKSLIIPGERYNEDILDKERERITNSLKDMGYYFFSRNYITYSIDTTFGNNSAKVYLYINRINENIDPALINNESIKNHQPYRIRTIYIQTDHNPKNPALSIPTDTTVYQGYTILTTGRGHILRNSELIRNIFVNPGSLYLQEKLDYSYRKLQDLNIFKFINIYFKEVPRDENQQNYLLDLFVELSPAAEQDLTIESEATNTGGNIGIAGSVGYRNKNIFKGAEVLELKIKGGFEAIPNFNDSVETKRLFFFNTYEIGPELSLGFKKLFLPHFIEKGISRYSNPKTSFNLGYNYQERPDYIRSVTNFSVNYSLSPTRSQRFIFAPEVNSVKVKLSSGFESKLEGLNDPRLFYTYDTHIISSFRVTYILSNQNLTPGRNFIFLRSTYEFAPKLFSDNLKPAEFNKIDFDFSYHHSINKYNNIVFRVASGVGLPFGNSNALPFEKSFFAGGANSVRAWSARTLGPGSYKKSVSIEQSGDIKIESNVEYRTELIALSNGIIIEGATFIDAGNVWTRNEDISRPDGQFELKHALRELGIGGGAGLRFNFSFFILRLDAAVKLRDPSLDLSKRWVYPNQKFGIADVNFNLAIGYPF